MVEPAQEQTILRAIAVSASGTTSQNDRQAAFAALSEFKQYDGRVALSLQWLVSERHVCEGHDITTQTKLLALEMVAEFLNKGYNQASEVDRCQLRDVILQAARVLANNTTLLPANETRILGKKLAAVLEGIVVRDFPQRWNHFTSQVFGQLSGGGLWYDDRAQLNKQQVGVQISLECLKLIAEDCTDSDYNAKISTQRRNDVLIGLNEVKQDFLPLLFRLLEEYPQLQQSKATLHQMNQYLVQGNRTIHSLSVDEKAQYDAQMQLREVTSQLISDTLVTLARFCTSMPIQWMIQDHNTSTSTSSSSPDFVAAMMHLLRERDGDIQIRAAECLEELVARGKLEYEQWMRLLVELPAAVGEANQLASFSHEIEEGMLRARGYTEPSEDLLAAQLRFHRILSKMLSTVVSSQVGQIINHNKGQLIEGKGADFQKLHNFLLLLVEILHHPSGRICTEQMNLWSMLLRDPQISKSDVLQPHVREILLCYMNQLVRIRWEDVEQEFLTNYKIYEASFDDEEDYDTWMADLRSKSSLLFRFLGSMAPATSSEMLNERLKACLASYGSGQPLDHLDPGSNQLTQKSDAVMQFEALTQPLENVLSGIPPWTLDDSNSPPQGQKQVEIIRSRTRTALAELARNLVSWNPEHLWLRFRRASLLETLKYYWKYDPSTLLQGVDVLIRYMGLSDEWTAQNQSPNQGGERMSVQTISLKKKSGVAMVAIAKRVPNHLVPWLTELSNTTSSLLSSPGLIPLNQMHLYEFLSCVASAVGDPTARAGFIANVLSNALETLSSPEVQQQIVSATTLMEALGIQKVGENPQNATNVEYVRQVSQNYQRLFAAFNQILSVGKRCNESARKRGAGGIGGVQGAQGSNPNHFPDEGPVSIQDLAINDPFAPLWPRILPSLVMLTKSVLAVWRPEHQAALLRDPLQRYALAISDDEAYSSKNQDKGGGVFGEGGTAGSVVIGADRRDVNLVPKWSGWFNELRNTCFQMYGLLATGRVWFAPEISEMFPSMVRAMTEPENLQAMEHRHFTQFLKHVCELVMVSCPVTLYGTHLAPIVGPVFDHIRYRLEFTWSHIVGTPPGRTPLTHATSDYTAALSSNNSSQAAELATKGGDLWFSWYYSHGGLFVGDLDRVTADSAVEKNRVDLSRVFSDVLQAALALKGDWALVLANRAKEEAAIKRNDPSKLLAAPRNQVNKGDVLVNADGSPKSELQASIDARKLLRINGLCHFLLLENEGIAGNLTMSVIQCLSYPDAYTVRRVTKICHRILETVAFAPQYTDLLAQQMFNQALKNIVTEPKWMVGLEWDMINILRDIYCRLVLGQVLQAGGQGPAAQQPLLDANHYEQSKTVHDPLHGGGILEFASQVPRQTLADIPGIGLSGVEQLDASLRSKRSAKDQKDCIRDFLRVASENLREVMHGNCNEGILLTRAGKDESLLHTRSRQVVVPALPEKLVTRSQVEKKIRREEEPQGLALFHIE